MKKIKILISWLLTALLVTSVCACSVSEPAETAEESDSMQESEESAEPSESEKPSETVEPSAIAEEETQEPSILPNAEDLEKLAAGISEEEPRESEDRKENNIWNGSVFTVTVNEFVDAFNAYLKERGPVVTNGTATLSVYTYTDNGDETYLIMFDGEERSGHIFLSFMNGEVAAQGNDYFDSVGVFVANSDVSENPGQWVDAIIATSQLLYFINPEEYISSAETFNDLKNLTMDKLSQRNEVTESWAVNGMDCILKMNITDGSYGFMAIGGEPENAQSNSDKSDMSKEARAIYNSLDVAKGQLKFVEKHAGETNEVGSMAWSDDFFEDLQYTFDNIDVEYINEHLPLVAEKFPIIQSNVEQICNMLVEMGETNSDKNVKAIKAMAQDTIRIIDNLFPSEYSSFT